MEKQIKAFTAELKRIVKEFYEATGATAIDVNVRISPYDLTHRVNVDFSGEERRDIARCCGGCKE